MLLHDTFETTAVRTPEAEALICADQRYRYGQLQFMVDRIAAVLQAQGVGRGDRVALFLPNGVELVVACYAALKIGAVFMPINPGTKRDKLEYMLRDSEAVALFMDARSFQVYRDLLDAMPGIHTRVLCGEREEDADDARTLSFSKAILGPEMPVHPVALIDQDLAAIIYTSGSTSDPKGVMLTHLNMLSASQSIITYLGLRSDDNILCVLPLSFDYGLYQVLMAFRIGAKVTLERSFAFPIAVLETMAFERITVLPGVPTIFSILCGLSVLPDYDLRALRLVTNTGAALSRRHIQDIRTAFPQAQLFSMYGLTECKRVSYLPPEELDRRPDSIGRGMPNEEVYLVDEAGGRVPPGGTGELVVRGSHVMRGYWRKPRETEACLRPGPIPGERVLYSGDLFRSDPDGWLYFVGRRDDMIKSRGEKVSPREVEAVLYGLEGVLEAAVIGVPDPLLGQAVKAFVALRGGYSYTEREVLRHCVANLEAHMVPRSVAFVDSLPKTSTGKIAKRLLTEAGAMGVATAAETQRTAAGPS
ncbi:MAG TPA: AMP-binding protein, partial [Acidiferrobacteraceae bacterium]|nr:AMP-binding protein [Acidiferrobacteraceae bacterium]